MFDLNSLAKFLIKSNGSGYAANNIDRWKKEPDSSTTITFNDGQFKMHDNFFGGEPFGGRMVVFYEEKPIWIMVYYGTVSPEITDIKNVYEFLQKALSKMPEDAPFRGPKEFTEGEFKYENKWTRDLENYSGEEVIFRDGKEIFKTNYRGGLVNQREEN